MRALSDHDLIDIWERGDALPDVERALILLAPCLPGYTREQLEQVSVGRRDALVIELRQATMRCALDAFATCPSCAGQLEYSLDPAALVTQGDIGELEFAGARCRLPDSRDLRAAGQCRDLDAARQLIFARCVEGRDPSQPAPEAALEAFAALIAERDPAADIVLAPECPNCGARWQISLDIVDLFWREIRAASRRILLEVDALARTYGWREADILGMSAARRQLYLELVG